MEKRLLSVFLLFICFTSANAQKILSGVVTDSTGRVLEDVAVTVSEIKNNKFTFNSYTDTSGHYSIKINVNVPFDLILDKYGYKTTIIPYDSTLRSYEKLVIKSLSYNLPVFKVVGRRYSIEPIKGGFNYRITDATVIKNSSSLELLNYTPFVQVSNDEVIKMTGKKNVVIFVNGRQVKMSPSTAITFLKNLPAGNVKSFNVILSPGPTYGVDAESGVIDVIVDYSGVRGVQGSVSINDTQTHFNKQTASFMMLYMHDKFSMQCNAAVLNLKDYEKSDGIIIYSKEDRYTKSNNSPFGRRRIYDFDVISEYKINKEQVLGAEIDIYAYTGKPGTRSNLEYGISSSNMVDSLYSISSRRRYTDAYFNADVYYKADFKKKLKLSSDLIFTGSSYKNKQHNVYDKVISSGAINMWDYENNMPQNSSIVSYKMDLETKLRRKSTLDIGIHAILSSTDYKNNYSGSIKIPSYITSLDNKFNYTDISFSPYLIYEYKLTDNCSTGIGCTLDYRELRGKNPDDNIKVFHSFFWRILPNAYINLQKGKMQLSYNMSAKSYYLQFNYYTPFRIYSSPTQYSIGNPKLLPAYILQQFVSIRYGGWDIMLTQTYSHNVPSYYSTVEDSQIVASHAFNYKTRNQFGFTAGYSDKIFKWWYLNGTASLNYTYYRHNSDAIKIHSSGWSLVTMLDNMFTVSESRRVFLHGSLTYFSNEQVELSHNDGMMQINLSVKKNFKNSSLSMGSYLSWTETNGHLHRRSENIYESDLLYRKNKTLGEYKGFMITYTWNFGNKNLSGNLNERSNDIIQRIKSE